jgi:hypothetical protein
VWPFPSLFSTYWTMLASVPPLKVTGSDQYHAHFRTPDSEFPKFY